MKYMDTEEQIKNYIASQPEPKRSDLEELHQTILQLMPECKLWFLDGKNSEGKTVSNPNIGYGFQMIPYADGSSREFYKIGLSANTTGISVYILGIKDKSYLLQTYGETIGKASVTGYCIKFKALKNIDIEVLGKAIRDGAEQ
jgi:Neuraminidase (sialidase)